MMQQSSIAADFHVSLMQLSEASLTAILDRLVAGLSRAVEAGQETGRLHAQRLASAFMVRMKLTHCRS